MPDLINFKTEAGQVWEEAEKSTIQQAALDIGQAIVREINRITEQVSRLRGGLNAEGEAVQPVEPIDPADAFLKVFGRQVTFLRKATADPSGAWGFVISRDEVWVHKNAPHVVAGEFPATVGNRVQFSVHELGHVFENVIAVALGSKVGRNSIPTNLLNRRNGFFQLGRFQQSKDPGRGEIFADMVIGWVYERWQTMDGSPNTPFTEAGTARKRFMDDIMIELIQSAITFNKGRNS
jgi:hypothetical protein